MNEQLSVILARQISKRRTQQTLVIPIRGPQVSIAIEQQRSRDNSRQATMLGSAQRAERTPRQSVVTRMLMVG